MWIRLANVAVPEYARLNTGGSITRANSGNGALLTREIRTGREHKDGPNEALAVAAMGVNRVKLRHAVFREKRYGHVPERIRGLRSCLARIRT